VQAAETAKSLTDLFIGSFIHWAIEDFLGDLKFEIYDLNYRKEEGLLARKLFRKYTEAELING
jgi:hypothetical protein